MVALPETPTDAERALLLTFEDDTNRAPWMVTTDLHSLAGALVREVLRRHRGDWYVSGELAVLYGRPDGRTGQVAPDALVAFAPTRPRDVFDSRIEAGGFPPFVLEVVSPESRTRDTDPRRKPALYRLLGAREYAIFDPRARRTPVLGGYRRGPGGAWEAWPLAAGGGLWSHVLGLELRAEGPLLRPYTPGGVRLPTEQEAREAAEHERAAERLARRAAEAALRAAEAEVAALRARLARHEDPGT